MKYRLPLFLSALFLLTACGGSSSSPKVYPDIAMSCEEAPAIITLNKQQPNITMTAPNKDEPKLLVASIAGSVSPTQEESVIFNKQYLYSLFQSEYYWAKETSDEIDYAQYTTPQTLINDIKNEKDKWSFAITKEDYTNTTTQQGGGFGLSCYDVQQGCHVTYVRIDSPADKVDLKRGDVISKINDKVATLALISSTGKVLEELVSLEVQRNSTNQRCNCKVTPRKYTYKVAQGKTVSTKKGEKVGYLRLDSFMGDKEIVKQIDEAFNLFKKESIKKLVIDLRYNGGGSVTVASKLLDKLTTTQTGEEQFTLAWNDDYKKKNSTYRFLKDNNSLELEKILFLTTQDSASASELVISAMKPYLAESSLITIGDRTHGKPVGMGAKIDGNYYYFLINFVVKNSLGFYDYFEGLPVTSGCNIDDDPFHEMGDTDELMLKAALHYIDTGSCQ